MKMVSIAVLVAGLAGAASGIDLTYLKTIDISSFSSSSTAANYIGSNPSAVAWDGQDLYVGGYNQAGAAAPTAINRVSAALNVSSLGATSFGAISTPNSRGLTSLAVRGGVLAAGLDSGAGNGDSVRAFNVTLTSPTLNWRIGTVDTTRRGDGVAFDPGFNGAGTNQGVAYLSIGGGRRHLLNTTTGAYINGQNAGAIINFNPVSTVFRDLAFDPATGDLYTRESNRVGKAVRSGDNSFSGGGSTYIVSANANGSIDNENIEFVNSPNQGNFVLYNDRSSVAGGQAFTNVVKAISTSGASLPLNLIGFSALDGNGAYDFSYNAASNTLAVSDFSNRQVYLFGVPTPGTLGLLGIAGIAAGRRRR
jgi:hypothetical protein